MKSCRPPGTVGEHRRIDPPSARAAREASTVAEQGGIQHAASDGVAADPGHQPGRMARRALHRWGSMGAYRIEARERTRRRGRHSSHARGRYRLRHEDRNRSERADALREGGAASRKDTRAELPLLPARLRGSRFMEPRSTTTAREDKSTPDECTCFECDAQTRTEWREHAFTYGAGASAVELNVTLPVRVCNSCGFEFLDHEAETLQHEAICAHLDVLTPKEIRGIRKMHRMSRVEFSKITGLGEATLNRWENAILIQNTANDRYLRLLASPDNIQRLERLDSSARSAARPSPSSEIGRFRVELSEGLRRQQAGFSIRKVA